MEELFTEHPVLVNDQQPETMVVCIRDGGVEYLAYVKQGAALTPEGVPVGTLVPLPEHVRKCLPPGWHSGLLLAPEEDGDRWAWRIRVASVQAKGGSGSDDPA